MLNYAPTALMIRLSRSAYDVQSENAVALLLDWDETSNKMDPAQWNRHACMNDVGALVCIGDNLG